jgi:hypothetical protein
MRAGVASRRNEAADRPEFQPSGATSRANVPPRQAQTNGAPVVAGHGRLAAARQLGLADVPVIPLKGLSELQRPQVVLG